jgi:5-methylcytosine-specific restriction endonuclease McrA
MGFALTPEYKRAWYTANKERILAKLKAWYDADPGKYRLATRTWRAANPDKIRTINRNAKKKWKAANPEQVRIADRKRYASHLEKSRENGLIYANRRRIRKAGNGGSHTIAGWIALCRASSWQCTYCSKVLDKRTATRDHVVPVVRGGSDDISNIVIACKSCNSRKGARSRVAA